MGGKEKVRLRQDADTKAACMGDQGSAQGEVRQGYLCPIELVPLDLHAARYHG